MPWDSALLESLVQTLPRVQLKILLENTSSSLAVRLLPRQGLVGVGGVVARHLAFSGSLPVAGGGIMCESLSPAHATAANAKPRGRGLRGSQLLQLRCRLATRSDWVTSYPPVRLPAVSFLGCRCQG
jgi:hypothetical protein